jgi:para-aminobenzoate synthetase component 1
MQIVKQLETYVPASRIFDHLYQEKNAVFLDSSLKNDLGRYSIIGFRPYLSLVKGETFTINGKEAEGSFEEYLKEYLKTHFEEETSKLPITRGAIGYFSYDYGRNKEGVKTHHPKDLEIPDCILHFYDCFVIEDLQKGCLYAVANGELEPAAESMKRIEALVNQGAELQAVFEKNISDGGLEIFPNFEKEEYKQAIDRMIQHIIEGDIYIANMTQHLKLKSKIHPYEMFRRLRKNNPSPFGGYYNYGDFQIVSASPERFLSVEKGHVKTRPIKGTRPRGKDETEDAWYRQELIDSEKDQSELLMIVDLERNDLNRVCIPGSVKVTELFSIEEYATVFHLISNVEGDLAEGMTLMDLIEAAFPGGSITGAPKLRAMEIIDELEHGRRNLYTGSLGYLTLSGNCDFNIVIRTAVYQDGVYDLGVGGGITYESDLEFEYEETLQKAKALLEALK